MVIMRYIGLVGLWLVMLFVMLPSSDAQPLDVEQSIQDELSAQGIDGAVVLVTQGDEIIYLQGVGTNAVGDPMSIEDVYDLGRASEGILVTGLMQAHERTPISFQTRLPLLMPSFGFATQDARDSIDLDALLTHTAGLGRDPDLAPLTPVLPDAYNGVEPIHFPTTRWSWCGRCNNLIAHYIEAQTGVSVEGWLWQQIFDPLMMDETVIRNGTVWAHPVELARLLSVYSQNGRWEGVQLVTPESITAMHRGWQPTGYSAIDFYGYGWFVQSGVGLDVVESPEDRIVSLIDIGNQQAHIAIVPAYQVGIAVLTDQPTQGLQSITDIILASVIDFSPAPFGRPAFAIAAYQGRFVLDNGDLAEEFTVTLDEQALSITYEGDEMPLTFIDDQTLTFRVSGTMWRLHFPTLGDTRQAILWSSQDAQTALYNRR